MTATPNQALQRTRLRGAAPVSIAAFPPTTQVPPRSGVLLSWVVRRCYAASVKQAILPLLLSALSTLAGEPWPGVQFAEVRGYAWPDDQSGERVILPGIKLKAGVLNSGGTVLTPDQVRRVRTAVSRSRTKNFSYGCYNPHNALVFYNAAKEPVAYIELCFSCVGHTAEPDSPSEYPDFLLLAKIFEELKLPMGRYVTAEAFKKEKVDLNR